MRIEEICTRCVETIAPDATAAEVALAMLRGHVGTLVVLGLPLSDRKPVGIVTDRDLVLNVMAKGIAPTEIVANDLMSPELHTCSGSQDVFIAAQKMRRHGVRRLPVVDDRGRLIGLIAADDIHHALADHVRELSLAMLKERVNEEVFGRARLQPQPRQADDEGQ